MNKNEYVQYSVVIPTGVYGEQFSCLLTLSGGEGYNPFDAIEELIGYFCRIANSGALAIGTEYINLSGIDVDCRQSEGIFQAVFTVRYLHLSAWRILLQILSHCHEIEPYRTLSLNAVDGYLGEFLNREQILMQAYPDQFVLSNINLSKGNSEFIGANFRLLIEFARKLEKGELADVGQLVDDWGSIVYTGGFTSVEIGVEDEILNKPNTYLVGSNIIEILISSWAGESHAISTLLNIALALSRKLPVVTIELE